MRTSLASTFALAIFALLAVPALAHASHHGQASTPWQWSSQADSLGGFVAPEQHGPVVSTGSGSCDRTDGEQPPMIRARMLGSLPSRRVSSDGDYVVEYSVVEEDGKPYLLERRRELEWRRNFPRYVGLLGMEFSRFTGLDHKNGSAGLFYRHLHSTGGPLYYGFEITPFSFGAVYDNHDFAALYSFQTRALGTLRMYLGSSSPSVYFELGAGLQFVSFRTADEFALIYENSYPRDEFSRWRAATRLAAGIEFGSFGLEIGWTGIFPTMEFKYDVYTTPSDDPQKLGPDDVVTKATVNGLFYVTATFRIGQRR